MKDYKAKIRYNKNNGQPMVCLKTKKLELLKQKKARYLVIHDEDIK